MVDPSYLYKLVLNGTIFVIFDLQAAPRVSAAAPEKATTSSEFSYTKKGLLHLDCVEFLICSQHA